MLNVSPGLVPGATASPFRLASQLQEDLRAVKKRFDAERSTIEARDYPRREVRALIDGTETQVGNAVDRAERKEGTLDPMRDWIRGEFDGIRAGQAPSPQAALPRLPQRWPAPAVIRFAAFVAPAAADDDESRWIAGLDRVSEVLDLLYDFVVDYGLELRVWVGSVPQGAFFQLYPEGELFSFSDEELRCRNHSGRRPRPIHEQLTNGTLKRVFAGSYTYRVEHSDYCIPRLKLDLLREKSPFCCLLDRDPPRCLELGKARCRDLAKRRKREAR